MCLRPPSSSSISSVGALSTAVLSSGGAAGSGTTSPRNFGDSAMRRGSRTKGAKAESSSTATATSACSVCTVGRPQEYVLEFECEYRSEPVSDCLECQDWSPVRLLGWDRSVCALLLVRRFPKTGRSSDR